jgi:divalent metal cation (Fe/Co/Zn/Cd) transporter
MTLLKLAAGCCRGSLGVLSDAAHSGWTWWASTLTFFSVQVSDKPADEDHTYGHGKFENLSAFGEAGLMAVSCAWIIWEAMLRIFNHTVELRHSVWPVLVLLTSIAWTTGGRGGCARWPSAPGRRRWPPTHFILPATSGRRWQCCAGWAPVGWECGFGIGWLRYADPFAAVVVSLMILRMTLHLGRETVAVLMDEVPAETRQRLVRRGGAGGRRAGRGAGAGAARGRSYFADLTLALPRRFTFEHTGELVRRHRSGAPRAARKPTW